ncbi:MAG: adenylate/guanylate cyclase domain-containing protein, partial [bacterium]
MDKQSKPSQKYNISCGPYLPLNIGTDKYCKKNSGTLVLADISGFTRISEQLGNIGRSGTEELTLIMDKFFEDLLFIVRVNQGNVLKFIGDAILVEFDHPEKARACSSQMLDKVRQYKNLESSGLCFALGIKIVIGSGSWIEYILGNSSRAEFFQSGELLANLYLQEKIIEQDQIQEIILKPDITYNLDEVVKSQVLSPTSFLPDDLFDILEKSSFGEHRPVSCLFVKVTGYDINKPDLALLDELFCQLNYICSNNKGSINVVDNLCADGFKVLIVFGAPKSYGNDTFRSVQSAWEIIQLNEKFSPLSLKISLNSGYVYAGMIGDDLRRHYTVIGDVVNSASRMVDSLENPGIVVSKNVFRMTSKYIDYESLPSIQLKGKQQKVERYTPVKIKEKISYQYDFIGRDKEMQIIINQITNKNSVIIITGEAGIGKTRLIDEIYKNLYSQNFNLISVKAEQLKPTYGIFADLIMEQANIERSDSDWLKKKKLNDFIEKNSSQNSVDLQYNLPILVKILFNLEYENSLFQQMTPEIRKENLLDGIKNFLKIIPKPALIVIDDLQYVKNEDFEALDFITRSLLRLSNENISFIFSTRPEQRQIEFDRKIEIKKINLKPLSHQHVERLILNILGGKPLDISLKDFILTKSGCNPLYLEQFLLYMLENNYIALKEQNWTKCYSFHEDKVPESLFSIILARIDKFQENIKEIIRLASVIGLEFKEEIIESILKKTVHVELESAENEGIIDIKNKLEMEYIFSHALIRDVIYESILNETRKLLHKMVGQIIEEKFKNDLSGYFSLLAYHFDYAEDNSKAAEYYVNAGQKAQQEYRNDEAIKYYRRVLELLDIVKNKKFSEQYFEFLCINLLDIYILTGQIEEAMEFLNSVLPRKHINKLVRNMLIIKKNGTTVILMDPYLNRQSET